MWNFFSKDPVKDFNYDIGDPIPGIEDKSIWRLHNAKRKTTGELFSVFVLDSRTGAASETQMELAKASVKRLKTVRHPNILTYVDSLQGDKIVYLVTEYVVPLQSHLSSSDVLTEKGKLSIAWGLHQTARALHFLNMDCGFVHHNVCVSSVFVNQAGEWKLGGVEYVSTAAAESPPIKIIPQLERYDPPEKSNFALGKSAKAWSADMWGFGCLIWEVFNGNMSKAVLLKSPGKLPKDLVPLYCELVCANPVSRPSPADFLSKCRSSRGYMKNTFIDTLLFLEEIQIKESSERTKFFNTLTQNVDNFPEEICRYKILPQLLSAFEFGGAGPSILTPLFKLGKLLTEDEYQKHIIPCVIKLFSSTDRATRGKLLQQMDLFVDHLQINVINNQVFPEIVNGFTDTNATIREVTVKSILHIAPKLNYNNLNVELMKHFARLQAHDAEGGIRTNTTVCLGKIAHHLHPDTRKKVLAMAFTRAMRDPFPPARAAGILALAATQKFYSLDDCSRRVLPALCHMTIDPDSSVREHAFKTIKGFLGKLEKVSDDPSLATQIEAEVNAASSVKAADTALGWAGWAVTSLTSKLYKSNLKSTSDASLPSRVSSAVDRTNTSSGKDVSTNVANKASSPSPNIDSGDQSAGNKKEDSQSDYEKDDYDDDDDDVDGWGEMDKPTGTKFSDTNSGWDDGDFEPIETDDATRDVASISNYNWGASSLKKSQSAPLKEQSKNLDNENNDNMQWDTAWQLSTADEPLRSDISRDERDQKRIQRRQEMAAKRAINRQSGPKKLSERSVIP